MTDEERVGKDVADRNAWAIIFGLAVARLVDHGWTRDQLIEAAAQGHDAVTTMEATGAPQAAIDAFKALGESMRPSPGTNEADDEEHEEPPIR